MNEESREKESIFGKAIKTVAIGGAVLFGGGVAKGFYDAAKSSVKPEDVAEAFKNTKAGIGNINLKDATTAFENMKVGVGPMINNQKMQLPMSKVDEVISNGRGVRRMGRDTVLSSTGKKRLHKGVKIATKKL